MSTVAPLITSRGAEIVLRRAIDRAVAEGRRTVGIVATEVRDKLFLAEWGPVANDYVLEALARS